MAGQRGNRATEPDATPTEDAPAAPVLGEFNPEVNRLLTFAQGLAEEKAGLFKRINANRDILRNYKSIGLLSEEQATAVDEFYPVPNRTKKSEGEGEGDGATATTEPAADPAAA